jgi:hypothetical protein
LKEHATKLAGNIMLFVLRDTNKIIPHDMDPPKTPVTRDFNGVLSIRFDENGENKEPKI